MPRVLHLLWYFYQYLYQKYYINASRIPWLGVFATHSMHMLRDIYRVLGNTPDHTRAYSIANVYTTMSDTYSVGIRDILSEYTQKTHILPVELHAPRRWKYGTKNMKNRERVNFADT